MDPTSDDDDARHIELETLEAIFPELRRLGATGSDGLAFELEIPIETATSVTVTFPLAGNIAQEIVADDAAPENGAAAPEVRDSLDISHFPPLTLLIRLPYGYPETKPPSVTISVTPQWLGDKTLRRLEDDGPRLWEEMGHDLVAYTYIDHIQRGAEDVFGTIGGDGTLAVDAEHKLAVLDFDIKAKKAAFEKETFECGICLDPKKGSYCHKMMDCEHIFCVQCLTGFYNDAVHEGNLSTVRCLAPNCAKEREAASGDQPKGRKVKTFISPSELLQIGLSEDMVKRYVTLKYKTELESDKNTIYCPRQWCNGAARSKRHKKPEGLSFVEVSDYESDSEDEKAQGEAKKKRTVKKKKKKKEKKDLEKFNPADLLAVCEDCGFAFCSRCHQSWHGEFVRCSGKKTTEELTEEERASIEYLSLHTSPCPTCSAPAQKTHGCNHMICARCDTHFCYLCSAWLDPGNPYKHYNKQPGGKVTSCYMRLWELEGGDGHDVGIGFGGQRPPPPQPEPAVVELEPVVEDVADAEDSEGDESIRDDNDGNAPAELNGRRPTVAREAPLVLRVMDDGRNAQQPPAVATQPQEQDRRDVDAGARGRGIRGGARGRAVRGGRARGGRAGRARQNQREAQEQQQQQQQQQEAEDAGLNPEQQAWVRRFLEMAMEDMEDHLHDDSDDDDANWMIR